MAVSGVEREVLQGRDNDGLRLVTVQCVDQCHERGAAAVRMFDEDPCQGEALPLGVVGQVPAHPGDQTVGNAWLRTQVSEDEWPH